MKICKVLIPFIDKVTGEVHKADTEIILSEERVAEIKAVNVNMIVVIGNLPFTEDSTELNKDLTEEVTEKVAKPKRKPKK